MSIHTATITVVRTTTYTYTGSHDIDWDDYLAWLDGSPHTNVLLAEYIDAGRDVLDIQQLVAERGQLTAVTDDETHLASAILQAPAPAPEKTS